MSDLALQRKSRHDYLHKVEQPQSFRVSIPDVTVSPYCGGAHVGLEETPLKTISLQYAPKLRRGYAAREQQVQHYSSAYKRHATPTGMNNSCGTVKVLHLLHIGNTSCYHARLDLAPSLSSHMHEDHKAKKGHTTETFRCLVLNVNTQVAKERPNHRVAHNYTCIINMEIDEERC